MNAVTTRSQVRALIFSGRPDPRWSLDDAQAARLQALWESLPPAPAPPKAVPRLGYRGLLVSLGDVEFLVHAVDVERRAGGVAEHRHDADRRIEELLLGSAPPGVLPPLG